MTVSKSLKLCLWVIGRPFAQCGFFTPFIWTFRFFRIYSITIFVMAGCHICYLTLISDILFVLSIVDLIHCLCGTIVPFLRILCLSVFLSRYISWSVPQLDRPAPGRLRKKVFYYFKRIHGNLWIDTRILTLRSPSTRWLVSIHIYYQSQSSRLVLRSH